MYYLRTRPAVNAIQFTLDQSMIKEAEASKKAAKLAKTSSASPAAHPTAAPIAMPSTPRAPLTAAAAPSINPAFAKLSISGPQETPGGSTIASPTPSHYGKNTPPASPSPGPASPSGPSEAEEISYEEAKRRAEERAAAALQCSIDNKDGELSFDPDPDCTIL